MAYLVSSIVGVDNPKLQINEKTIESFIISCSIDELFYEGEVVIRDTHGDLIKKAEVPIGATVILSILDIETSPQSVYQVQMAIVSLEQRPNFDNDSDMPMESGGGFYTIKMVSPWFYRQSIKSKAYKSKFSEIIKTLAEDTKKWKFNSVNIVESDDSMYARYQTGENDYEFINKYKSRVTIGNKPAYIYVNDRNDFVLDSFNNMFIKEAKASIMPPRYQPPFDDLPKPYFSFKMLSIQIGTDSDTVYELKEKTNIFDLSTLKLEQQLITFRPEIKGKFPILDSVLANTEYFDMEHYSNMISQDIYAINVNQKKKVYEAVDILCVVDFFGFDLTIGDCVYLYIPILSEGSTAEKAALSGKYLIKKLSHVLTRGSFFSKIELIRPHVILATDEDEKALYSSTSR